jgi:BCD family chlorophyll transporter-like MFS transporter
LRSAEAAMGRFSDVWRSFIARPGMRRFLWSVALGTAAFNMQDIVLEPYGAEVLGLSVSGTTALTALLACGALVAFAVAARLIGGGADPLRIAAMGALVGLPAFSLVILSAPIQAPWLFRAGTVLIGLGGGMFSVGTLTAAMQLDDSGHVGLALGAWGSVQATVAGASIAVGGIVRDAVAVLAIRGDLGEVLQDPSTGYSLIYHVEMALLFAALIAIGPLIGAARRQRRPTPGKFGLAELPG